MTAQAAVTFARPTGIVAGAPTWRIPHYSSNVLTMASAARSR